MADEFILTLAYVAVFVAGFSLMGMALKWVVDRIKIHMDGLRQQPSAHPQKAQYGDTKQLAHAPAATARGHRNGRRKRRKGT